MNTRMFLLLLTGLVLVLFTVPAAHADEIVGIGGLRLDVKGNGGKGTPVIVWPRNGKMNQQWSYNGREIRTASGLCLDVKGRGGKGTQLIVWPCNGQSNQSWDWVADGTIQSGNGMCMDVAGGKAVQGANVIIWPCHGRANQQWR